MQNHKKLEDLLSHLCNGVIDKSELDNKAKALAKRAGSDLEDRYFYSKAILFDAKAVIAKQYNIDEQNIDVVMSTTGGDGSGLIIEGQHIEDIETFNYWRSGCWQ